MTGIEALLAKIDRLESMQQLRELPHRYAMAVDARNIDAYLDCFIPDVDCGRRGKGREAFRPFVEAAVRNFYRSVHHVVGHVIDSLEGDRAAGRVYGRCEHEVGDKWIVQANIYFDEYERRDGQWYFVRRDEDFFYSADLLERPQEAGFERWPGLVPRHNFSMMLDRHDSWLEFWADTPNDVVERITTQPGRNRIER